MRIPKRGHGCYYLMTCYSEKAEVLNRAGSTCGLAATSEDQLEAPHERVRGKSVSTSESHTGVWCSFLLDPVLPFYSKSFVTP